MKDWQPSQAYYAFASAAGCDTKNAYLHNGSKPIFDCLVETDAATLMNASADVSQSGSWATWAFLPVTDGKFIQSLPSKQLAQGNINGLNQLSGHNALEGAAFVSWNISTVNDLVDYLHATFPMLSNNDIAKILLYYPTNNGSVNPDDPTWATEGDSGATTLNQSTAATGQKQRAIAIYGETTFICPSYWLAEAYSNNMNGGKSWKYQFSIPNAYHGADGAGYVSWPYTGSYYSSDYILAFMQMLGNFIVNDNPSISNTLANGLSTGNASHNPASEWPDYSIYAPWLMDFNTTCPSIKMIGGLPYCTGPGEMNTFRLADAYTWEGGRGFRCDFWKSLAELVPE
ncbi:putative carboxylesterase type b [Diaporthe ampelina]|uniref:Putative carboxylesterase type b n=1 Tax=Diaporthe ampelina TaxID=1214573 RepID=A0A0G2H2U4_9PEZI|nr:putative carboxylesterase type b [Diaporthe ampelina]